MDKIEAGKGRNPDTIAKIALGTYIAIAIAVTGISVFGKDMALELKEFMLSRMGALTIAMTFGLAIKRGAESLKSNFISRKTVNKNDMIK